MGPTLRDSEGGSFVAAAMTSSSLAAASSCPADPLRTPRAVLLFTGHLRGTCDASRLPTGALLTSRDKIEAIVNQTRWCREAFGSGCRAFLHTWSTLDKALIPPATLARLNLSHGSRGGSRKPSSSAACVEQIRAAVESQLRAAEGEAGSLGRAREEATARVTALELVLAREKQRADQADGSP